MKINRTYSEMLTYNTLVDRYRYLKLGGAVGKETFGYERHLNQVLYKSPEWKRFRRDIIIRDKGLDLVIDGLEIFSNIFVHHINPITVEDVIKKRDKIFDPENVVCCSFDTHQAIHYGDESMLRIETYKPRFENDTCPWRC